MPSLQGTPNVVRRPSGQVERGSHLTDTVTVCSEQIADMPIQLYWSPEFISDDYCYMMFKCVLFSICQWFNFDSCREDCHRKFLLYIKYFSVILTIHIQLMKWL